MTKDTIYDNISKKISETDFEYFFKNSFYSEEELKLVEKIAYSVPQNVFRKLFQMIRLNIIQPLNLTEITNFNSDALSTWIDMKIEDAHFFDYQSIDLSALIAIDNALSPLPLVFARSIPLNKTIKEFLFAFDYYSLANTNNSYRSKANFVDDFRTKMGLNDPISELSVLVDSVSAPFDFSEINSPYIVDTINGLDSKLFTTEIVGDIDTPSIFSAERLHDLCFCSKLNLSNIQIFRSFFVDLINWQFPYTNFNDVREFLGEKYMTWNALKDSVEGVIPPTPYVVCQEEISNILSTEGRISFYAFNRALICLCYIESVDNTVSGIESLISLLNATIFNKISIVNQILNFIKNNVYAVKYTNV